MRRRLGDRKDGYKLRHLNDQFFRVMPHIMKTRNDAQIFFEDRVYLEKTNKIIRQLRNEGYKLGFLHVVIASMVRIISQKPKINRFIAGRKIYARNEISFSLAVKKEMSEDSEETIIKILCKPTDTLYDVVEKINTEINANKHIDKSNNTDIAAKLLGLLPGFMLTCVMSLFRFLDYFGLLPRFLTKLSPFHSSVFVTDLGSIGIRPVYHHLYNFGTNTIFIAFGTRSKEQVIDRDLSVKKRKAMDMRIVSDERVVDGYYFANTIKLAKEIIEDPEILLNPPKSVIIDDEI